MNERGSLKIVKNDREENARKQRTQVGGTNNGERRTRKTKMLTTRKLDPSGCKRRYNTCGDFMTPYASRKQLTLACMHRL